MDLKKVLVLAGATVGAATAMAADDVSRAYAAELLGDAGNRTSALAAPMSSAPVVGGYTQFRYNWNHRDQGNSNAEDSTNGFQVARTALNVQGQIGSPNWKYFVQGDFIAGSSLEGSSNGSFLLEDAYGQYVLDNGWTLQWGQYKDQFTREELVGDTTQLDVDRSVFNRTFGHGRVQGFSAMYQGDSFRGWLTFSDGANTANTDFDSQAEADFGLTARGEYKWAGDWKQSNDFTSFQNSPFFGMVGAAAHYQNGGDTFASGTGQTADVSLLDATVDVSVEGNGWNAFAAFAYRHVDPNVGSDTDDFGFLVQGGIFVAPQWELFGRFDIVVPDDDYDPNDNTFTSLTIGANYYFVPESHAAKFTVDFQYFFDKSNETAIVSPSTLGGLLGSGDDGEWNLRAQMQLVF